MQWLNLSERSNDGLYVSLDYCKTDEEIRVTVSNLRTGEGFNLYPDPAHALECFHHPYAYAQRALQAGRLDRMPAA